MDIHFHWLRYRERQKKSKYIGDLAQQMLEIIG